MADDWTKATAIEFRPDSCEPTSVVPSSVTFRISETAHVGMAPIDEPTLERLARRWCERMGIDPDATVAHGADPGPNGNVPMVQLYSPRWQRAVREIRPMLEVIAALEDVRLEELQRLTTTP